MSKIIEPPILMSRIMTFVLATSIVVLAVLVVTLFKMVPLERPEVFFVLTGTRSFNTVIEPLVPNYDNQQAIADYEKGFVREYIIMRNTLYPSVAFTQDANQPTAALTRKNWTSTIRNWSSDKVYAALTKTELYKEYMLSDKQSTISCHVNFSNKEQAVVKTASGAKYDEYAVDFTWVCENIGGQTTQKNYKIRLRIQSVLDKEVSSALGNLDKIRANPLGIQVTRYTILEGDGDPLNSNDYAW